MVVQIKILSLRFIQYSSFDYVLGRGSLTSITIYIVLRFLWLNFYDTDAKKTL